MWQLHLHCGMRYHQTSETAPLCKVLRKNSKRFTSWRPLEIFSYTISYTIIMSLTYAWAQRISRFTSIFGMFLLLWQPFQNDWFYMSIYCFNSNCTDFISDFICFSWNCTLILLFFFMLNVFYFMFVDAVSVLLILMFCTAPLNVHCHEKGAL